ncbi:uncharacterized protein E0L32_004428 [Thyridium curvatum]|uniref:Sulfatase N-terminal domain-containing protein n=1 Tax=Thyridium curvatum TaxID=1093900 RepID=A0A507BFF5_9PEZI|nr:uncharacterized protein E0L32_004428 [Thyridium curvatum]TPX15448.1 hypothetical protein E0L32_004428 [Thyridium curvatum]
MKASTLLSGALLAVTAHSRDCKPRPDKRPNIVMIMTDDQDYRLGSTDYQFVLQRLIKAQGVEFLNHYATTANCCPSRASFMRGQMVHNTNITHVNAPGGNYDKFVASELDQDYLPHWMNAAGYRTEYIGKFLNGYGLTNYLEAPKGWHHVDALLDPYTQQFNTPVTSINGGRPIWYTGFHQSDVVRAKAVDRIEHLTSQEKPFLLVLAPSSPHVQNDIQETVPLARHAQDFENVTAPRTPNFNPSEEFQKQKGSWLPTLPLMNDTIIAFSDHAYRQRIRGLQGVDEIMEDVINTLEQKGVLDNTYVIFTSDNGYKVGTHRVPAGKATFYAEDSNLPFFVRGPGIPKNITSKIPGAHLDLGPTFLDIAGVPQDKWPSFFDGQSLLPQWHDPESSTGDGNGGGNAKETLNVEFWGLCIVEAPNAAELGVPFKKNSYKTLRIVGSDESWLYSYWCTGEVELYNTAKDPYELTNLALNPTPEVQQLLNRLNAILLVTKSCEGGTCRQPWGLLQPNDKPNEIVSLKQAMDPKYDVFFAKFPKVNFKECLAVQDVANEQPFYPPLPDNGSGGLGRGHRTTPDGWEKPKGKQVLRSKGKYGTAEQRHATLEDVMKNAHYLTDDEIAGKPNSTQQKRAIEVQMLEPSWFEWIG